MIPSGGTKPLSEGGMMNRETTFWSVVTALALVVMLVLLAQQQGMFEIDDVQTDTTSTNPSSNDVNDTVEDSGSNVTNTTDDNETVEDSQSNETNTTENQSSTADSPDPLALDCVQHSGLARHDHVTVQIFIDNNSYTVESNIGINTDACNENENMHTIHTHDDTGKLHVELNEPGNISLGVFFDIWGHNFNETGIFDYRINATHEMVMYVHASGENATEENRVLSFDDYLLQNGEVIEVHYRAKAN